MIFSRKFLAFLGATLCIHRTECVQQNNEEPMCLSRFDYDFKVMSNLVTLDLERRKIEGIIQQQSLKFSELEQSFKDMSEEVTSQSRRISTMSEEFTAQNSRILEITENTVAQVKSGSCRNGDTYIRWGKSSCPSNGTQLVYQGYMAGGHYTHKGTAVNYLCLPTEPLWGKYEDQDQGTGMPEYGAEYEFSSRFRSTFFGSEIREDDAPCASCITSRSSVVMIPGRNKCFDGWTFHEYNGYLASGHYTHEAASEFICVDERLDVVQGGKANKEGKLLYLTEARCGSLPCPPYVMEGNLHVSSAQSKQLLVRIKKDNVYTQRKQDFTKRNWKVVTC